MYSVDYLKSFLPAQVAGDCDKCCIDGEKGITDSKLRHAFDSFKLDTSQEAAVLSCLAAKKYCHKTSCTKLIWGPPGTGKTKTVASLLFVLLRAKHRTLTCAPTNIAVVGVAKRLLSLLSNHDLSCETYGFGDIVLFGNKERMKISVDHEELLDVFLDYRVNVLGNCLSLWKTYTGDMIRLLQNPMKEYQCFLVPKKTKAKSKKEKEQKPVEKHDVIQLTFEEFVMNRFSGLSKKLTACIRNLYTHLPTSVIPFKFAKKMNCLVDLIQKVGESVKEIVTRKQSLKKAFDSRVNISHFMKLRLCKTECLQALNDLRAASFIPKSMNITKLKNFCLSNACLIFCTASSSIKLCIKGMTPIEMVLIDEAAQLKECESVIPLQLPGVRNAVLVGDERQLPPMVQSKICYDAKFGRSLFERLVLLGHRKHLLNVQYRMHPSISQFPNTEFYNGQILDGPNVIDKAREQRFLQEDMYGAYSFINVDSAKEEFDKNHSTKNMVEVAVIAQIVANLFEGSCTLICGSVGFLSSRERANVALTRARHCLWIVGNKETMIKSGSVWNTLVYDAENRGCVFDAHEDKNLAQVIIQAMIEFANFGSLLKTDSIFFKEARWKVNFTNTFLERIAGISNPNVCKQVASLLVKLSSGWRQAKKNKSNSYNNTRAMFDMLEIYNVDGHFHLVWSVDIVYENSLCVQVLKFWDILVLSQIQQRAKHLESAFGNYTLEMINRCQTKRLERYMRSVFNISLFAQILL
ncbi:putative P-loop containing nucleoside triphosphate hydrolase, DNA2/NAM7 helicase, helicase [Helianthus annuus]|nr:putative P-loop containing nucleoside triphosphate hydrolase, DNA2/NAM7 helicase, helicase [Helianthus annuus]